MLTSLAHDYLYFLNIPEVEAGRFKKAYPVVQKCALRQERSVVFLAQF